MLQACMTIKLSGALPLPVTAPLRDRLRASPCQLICDHAAKYSVRRIELVSTPMSLSRYPDYPGRSAQGCSCWHLGCLLVIPRQASRVGSRQECDLSDQVDAGCRDEIMDEL